jgi:muramoyltetrapeptide carboxypeptidase LdcA involved in peptidoglycan recycling
VTLPPPLYPSKLRPGDHVRVIAPSRSRALVLEHDHSALIEDRFAKMGLSLSYGDHVDERDSFDSSSVPARVADLHAAFADPAVQGILTVIGGFNSNELLPYLDWDLIAANPKIFCGYSDITVLQNAMLARTGLVTYSGPHWSTFGMRDHFDDTWRWFRQACLSDEPFEITPAAGWTDDLWFADQDGRTVTPTDGWWTLTPGQATGRLVGGNLATLNLLQGTAYWPTLDGAIVAVEDDELSDPATFARDLTSLLQQPDAAAIRGLLIGRFQRVSEVTRSLLEQIAARQPVLAGLPVLGNVDFGHTNPLATLPIGGRVELIASDTPRLRILDH